MKVLGRSSFTSNNEWFRNVLHGKDVVLSHTSALECLGYFTGYVHENQIDVYAKAKEPYENINWNIVKDFNGLEIVNIGGLRCTSLNQTINDMFRDYDVIDEPSLAQSLADFYYENGESFDGISVEPQYSGLYLNMQNWAKEFYEYA